jgi:hypothetical protein
MAPVFIDLPADSAELQTLHGYAVYGPRPLAGGGPPPVQPKFSLAREAELGEFLLDFSPPPVPLKRRATRRYGDPFPPNHVLWALLFVPMFSGFLVWAVGRFPL